MTTDDLPGVDDLYAEEEEKQQTKRTMFPFLLLGFLKGVETTADRVKPQDLMTFGRRLRYESKSQEYAALVVGVTKEKIRDAIDRTAEAGDGVRGLAKRINELYDGNMGWRSLRIARSQLTETINDGTYATLEAEGHRTKAWSTVIDGAERDSHAAADGQEVGIHEAFRLNDGSSGLYPGDDAFPPGQKINCRCTMVGGEESPARARVRGRLFLRAHGALERRYVVSLRRAFRSERDRVISRLPS